MRVALIVTGAVTLVAGLMAAAAIFALLPTHVSVLGVSGSCGAPLVTAFDEPEGDDFGITEQCISQSRSRVLVAVAAFVIGGGAGAVMIALSFAVAGPRRAPPPWPPYGPPHR